VPPVRAGRSLSRALIKPGARQWHTMTSTISNWTVYSTRHRAMRGARLRSGFVSTPRMAIEAEASVSTTLRDNGAGCRAEALPEGAQLVRRCARFSKSAHLGKPREFLRRCAPFSKVRTEKCASSKGGTKIVCQTGPVDRARLTSLYAYCRPGLNRFRCSQSPPCHLLFRFNPINRRFVREWPCCCR